MRDGKAGRAVEAVCNLRTIREALNKTQHEMAALLGVSARAIQSYEQGWRPFPPHVQKMAGAALLPPPTQGSDAVAALLRPLRD